MRMSPDGMSLPTGKGCKPGERTKEVAVIPPKALHLKLEGEIRTWEDPESSLYNTDGMIFSDTGIPVILFMENYDIDRTGYHDTHDTMENIDLDYGAAVSCHRHRDDCKAGCILGGDMDKVAVCGGGSSWFQYSLCCRSGTVEVPTNEE